MSVAIAIESLVKVFGSGQAAARAVDGVSLDIEPGELFFLLGPSGCGKTTLLRMVAGFNDPTSGHIKFGRDGQWKDVTHTPPNKRNTGMVFQSYALWPHMSVEANVAFGLGVRKVPADEKTRRALEALTDVQMQAYAKRKPNQLSGGQQQRVALARALVIRPDVLLLDEPLSNLDAKLRNDLRLEIRRICKDSGLTTIYVTHDQKEALSMADRIALLRDGKVVQLGTPKELYRAPKSRFVAEFLGETNLIEAKIASHIDRDMTLDSQAGTIAARAHDHAPTADGSDVLCSLRPEALRITTDGPAGTLRGTVAESTYMGEIAHHLIDLPGHPGVKVSELNPLGATASHAELKPGDRVGLTIDPADVVVLAHE
ncbi:MAG: polyamine ABC transporter ATP-binding protein [Phycisphaeraceae bacterium]|nr:MAG: polyamine ABC transporter ATP-binding protein [Phycisphaeraceae bacterium]